MIFYFTILHLYTIYVCFLYHDFIFNQNLKRKKMLNVYVADPGRFYAALGILQETSYVEEETLIVLVIFWVTFLAATDVWVVNGALEVISVHLLVETFYGRLLCRPKIGMVTRKVYPEGVRHGVVLYPRNLRDHEEVDSFPA